ncbi:hypothetical protein H6P81_013610 [Aristolochia fimbriata]|uniref:DOMON domain-containing protein n=1 Tax=Aristolochia fimbriata TaxID=158543 RepID=A0AAV7EIG9_ARIFI|nr:hypothetical protein H6P81_013610 [Aristolochia fimbriata]
MESSSSSYLRILVCVFSALMFFTASAQSASCNSQTLPANKAFKLCADLPTLSSFLHWTYDASNSSLSMAFVAPPEKPEGWVAWGINPAATRMLGTQALIAHRSSKGSLVVQTFNVSDYRIQPSNISYPVSGLSAAVVNGSIVIFATWELPKGTTTVNQVWQVGPSVDGGIPAKHAMAPANMNAVGKLNLLRGTAPAPGAESPSPSSSSSSPPASPNSGTPSSATVAVASSSLLGFVWVAVAFSVLDLIR